MENKRIICFDTETTGFDYAKGDRIIEMAAVELINGKITENKYHEYINPDGKIISSGSYNVHKLSNAFLEDKPKFAAVAQKFLNFVGDSPIVAHNGIDFDFPFVNYELRQAGLPEIPRDQQRDSIVIARHKVFGPKEYTLDALAKWFNISLATRADSHGALIDAEILAKVYLELERADEQRTNVEIMAEQHDALLRAPKSSDFPRRAAIMPTAEEKFAHDEFMSKILK